MTNRKRQTVEERILNGGHPIQMHLEYESVTSVIKKMAEVIEEFGNEYEDITVRMDTGSYYEEPAHSVIEFWGRRWETDEEYEKRTLTNDNLKKIKEKKEREEFERLKKKFG